MHKSKTHLLVVTADKLYPHAAYQFGQSSQEVWVLILKARRHRPPSHNTHHQWKYVYYHGRNTGHHCLIITFEHEYKQWHNATKAKWWFQAFQVASTMLTYLTGWQYAMCFEHFCKRFHEVDLHFSIHTYANRHKTVQQGMWSVNAVPSDTNASTPIS